MGMAIESTVNTMDSASKCSISQTPPISPNFLLQYCDLAKSTGRQQSINLKIHQQRNATSVSSQYLLRTESVSMSMEILRRRYGDGMEILRRRYGHDTEIPQWSFSNQSCILFLYWIKVPPSIGLCGAHFTQKHSKVNNISMQKA